MIDEIGKQKQPEKVVRGVFGLSEQDVLRTIEEAKANDKGGMLTVLTSGTPLDVLRTAQSIYDKALEIEATGIERKEIIQQLRSEFPNIEEMYWLLRKQPWGYQLGQAIFAQKMLDEEDAKYGPLPQR